MNKFINDILLEISLDSRIPDGIVDLTNYKHTQILAEQLFDREIPVSTIVEVINDIVAKEGKYPDRQAYNKEGWLVTFPSAEYKQAAIKKGTHFSTDPTHGKGGMNLYYKAKGKQKRMTQQQVTQVDPNAPQQSATAAAPVVNQPVSSVSPAEPFKSPEAAPSEKPTEEPAGSTGSTLPKSDTATVSDKGAETPSPETPSKEPSQTDTASVPSASPTTPSAPATPPAPVVPSYVTTSIEFAKSKTWTPTPYGEWRNAMGETTAVVALNGEVVPIKVTDREELKLLANKKRS